MRYSPRQPVPRIRGTAIIETLLVFIPVWTFFFLSMHVLQFWERKHIDQSVEMENMFAIHTITALLFDDEGTGTIADRYSDSQWTAEAFENSNYAGTATETDPALPKHYYYVTGSNGRRLVVYRGTNTWCSFIWLRGQHTSRYKDDDEDDRRREWFEEMGNSVLEDTREHLLTGS